MTVDPYRDSIFWVEVDRIKPNPYQPRREFDQVKLQELSDSIRMYGLLQPLTVTRTEIPHGDGSISVEYELIAGERRLRASRLANLTQVPVIIRSGEETDQMKLELAIIENLQREDLNPIDRARAFDRLARDFKFTHVEIGKKVGKSREYVSNTLRLLLLPEEIISRVAAGDINEGHTRPLLMLKDQPDEQATLAREIVLKKLTVRESENLARRSAQDKVTARHKIDPEILSLERALTERLGTRVTIEPREVGGRLVISFFSAGDLQALLDSMRVEREEVPVDVVYNGLAEQHAALQAARAPAAPKEDIQEVGGERGGEGEGSAEAAAVVSDGFRALEDVAVEPSVSDLEPSPDRPLPEVGMLSGDPAPESELAPAPEHPQVVPSADRPQPEPDAAPSVSVAAPRTADEDLYSLRNFSI